METNAKQLQIIKDLNDNRNKLSALFSLYNTSLLSAEENRVMLVSYYEKMVDFKNDLSAICKTLAETKKSERANIVAKQRSKINRVSLEAKEINVSFDDSCTKYRKALQECGNLKTEYKHTVSDLCKEFKSTVDESTPSIVIKGYKQQVKIIKAILDRIEVMISDYNVKKNKVEEDNLRFNELTNSVNSLITQLKTIA